MSTSAWTDDVGAVPTWTISDRLRKAREHAGLSQAELAERADIGRKTVSNYEAPGGRTRKAMVIKVWALACGVSWQWIAGESSQIDRCRDSAPVISLDAYRAGAA